MCSHKVVRQVLIQRDTKGYPDTKDAVANYLGHRTGEGFGNLGGEVTTSDHGSVCHDSTHSE